MNFFTSQRALRFFLCCAATTLLLSGCVPDGSGIRTRNDATDPTDGTSSGTEDTAGGTSGTEDTLDPTADGTSSGTEDTNVTTDDTNPTTDDTVSPPTDTVDPDITCTPLCEALNLECGTDPACGGSCGTCDPEFLCDGGLCVPSDCTPDCSTVECGNDPVCNQPCGSCDTDETCTFGTCQPNACIPDCTGRECGLDPVCAQSCGDCLGSETCSGAGQCQSAPNGSPVVNPLTVNPTTITPTASGLFSATVTDPNGLSDITGGILRDPSNGATYGSFTGGTGGNYSVSMTWNQINTVRTIDAATGSTSRVFEAVFSDAGGNQGTRQVTATLSCGVNSATCTPGTCSALTSLTRCGSCTNNCNDANFTSNDLVVNATACVVDTGSAHCTFNLGQLNRASCTAACSARGLTCDDTQTQAAGYIVGACLNACSAGSCPTGQTCTPVNNSAGQTLTVCIPDNQSVAGLRACSLDSDCGTGGLCTPLTEGGAPLGVDLSGCAQTPAAAIPPDASLGLVGGDWNFFQVFCKCRR